MSDLIKQVGGIEKAKDIVNGAPENSQYWRDMDSICSPNEILYYVWFDEDLLVFDVDDGWVKSIYHSGAEYIIEQLQNIDDLRQAIADYNTDHCTNIENHISPSTVRIEK